MTVEACCRLEPPKEARGGTIAMDLVPSRLEERKEAEFDIGITEAITAPREITSGGG